MKFKRILSAILVLIVIATSIPISPTANTAAAAEATAFKGVDISRWNGKVDWEKLKKRGVSFVILRCYSYGKDINFDKNYEDAVAAGLDVGAYVFMYATSKKEAIKEATAAIDVLDGKALDYPLFLDIEYEKLPSLGKKKLTDYAIEELNIFKNAGYDTGIYASKNFIEKNLDMTRLSNQYVWTAKWSLYTKDESKKKFKFKDMSAYDSSRPDGDLWQFTDGGYGSYYGTQSKYVDLNYCYVDFKNKVSSTNSKLPESYTVPQKVLMYNSAAMTRGTDVAWVQAVLYQLGLIASVDGVYNPMTKTAVMKFQELCGLAESGIVDAQTLEMLKDVYEHRAMSANIKYDPNNGSKTVSAAAIMYGTSIEVGADTNFKNGSLNHSGWTVYRGSDKTFLCTDGIWRTESIITSGGYLKRIFAKSQKISIDSAFFGNGTSGSDTFTFTAVWSTQKDASEKIYYNETIYEIFEGDLSYEEAEKYCIQRGGELAVLTDTAQLAALKTADIDGKLFVGAKNTDKGFFWNNGKYVAYPIEEKEEPTEPTTEPTEPTTEPTEPTTEPAESTTEPAETTTEPAETTTEPAEMTTEPAETTTEPAETTTEPAESTTEPTEPTTDGSDEETTTTESEDSLLKKAMQSIFMVAGAVTEASRVNNYLAISKESLTSPYKFFAVTDETEVKGFVMQSKCTHSKQFVKGVVELTCTTDGYSGDKICSDCGRVVLKGVTVECAGHIYGKEKVIKKATCKNTGSKQKVCEACGYVHTEVIPKSNNHVIKTTVIKKATTKKSGKATDKCKVCGYKKTYTVKKIKSASLAYSSAVYTGSKLKPKVTVKNSSGKKLKKNRDYTVSYKNNNKIGKATVTIKFKGKYEGTITKTFKIIPKATSISSLKAKSRSATVKWKKKNLSGYVIEYSTSSKFKKKTTTTLDITNTKTGNRTIKGLKKGKKIYFRVRCYKVVNGTRYYSKWSKVKSVKIK